jgi:tRNA(Met) C34 N-acetyltransferase TmcA
MNALLTTADITNGLTEQQQAAFKELHRFALGNTDSAMAVLRGFAGTGKTYLISRLIHALGGSGMSIAVAAPTNKAVRVLRDKIIESGIEHAIRSRSTAKIGDSRGRVAGSSSAPFIVCWGCN